MTAGINGVTCRAMQRGLVMLVQLATAVGALGADGPGGFEKNLGLRGAGRREELLVDADGRELWRLNAAAAKGTTAHISPGGSLVFGGHTFSEATATACRDGLLPGSGYVFETRFTLPRPTVLIGHLLFLSPRVTGPTLDDSYRVSYCFRGPGRFANNQTGFFLFNTATEEYRKQPVYAAPLAGAPYKLVCGREYTAYTAIEDTAAGVRLRFFLRDPAWPQSDTTPLFDYTDESPQRLAAGEGCGVQVGGGGFHLPAAPVCFREMRVTSLDRLGADRRDHEGEQDTTVEALTAPPPSVSTRVANVFSDHMVLQRSKRLPVWGRGIAGDEIRVSLAGQEARARVVGGAWKVELDPLPAGGPHVLTVQGKDRTVTVANVLIGEVWVLGGQSNMCWGVEACVNAEAEIADSNCPWLRIFAGWHPPADEPQFDLAGGSWRVVSPALQGRFSAVGYFFARALHERLDVPIGLIDTSVPATGIEVWVSQVAADRIFRREASGQYPRSLSAPSVYFNGKVAPVMPFAIAGILWYQGDGSSPAVGLAYRRRIPALIRDWREGFGQGDLPFGLVQIPRYKGCSPEMRESAMLAAVTTPNAGMAVVLDTGEPDDIHPRHKKPVGQRLALIARALAYGDRIAYMGPIYRSMDVHEGKAWLTFDHTGSGLELKGTEAFEIRGTTEQYRKANAAVAADGRLMVWSDEVPQPAAVRYAWASVPEINLYNKEGLLASPFRTDMPESPDAK